MTHVLERLRQRFKLGHDEFSIVIGTRWCQLEQAIANGQSPRHKYVCRAYRYAKAHGIRVTLKELMEEDAD